MNLRTEVVIAAVVMLVLTAVAIGAVGAEVVGPLATQQGIITDLRMSTSCGGSATTLFPAGTGTVYVVFDYSNMQGEPYRIKVADGVTLHDESHSYTASSTECITITHTSGPIPPDTYQTLIYAGGGHWPIKTLLWHVRLGGPGEITSLYMSLSPGGPPKEQFIEGTKTVWAVFDYANMEGNEVGINVYEGDRLIYESPRVPLTAPGPTSISVTHPWITGFPPGEYRTHVVKVVDEEEFVDGVANWSVLHGVYLPLVLKNHP